MNSLWPIRKRTTLTVLLAGLLALAIVGINEASYRDSTDVLKDLSVRAEARLHIQTLWRVLVDAETGQRGYILTGKREYLKPYDDALTTIEKSMAWIGSYYGADTEAAPIVSAIKSQIEEKQAELAQTLQYFDKGMTDSWKALLETDRGRQAMDAVRTATERLLQIESERVRTERLALLESLQVTRIAVNVMTGLSLLASLLFLRQVNLTDRQQRRHTAELKTERDLLEREVESRTAELTDLAKHLQSAREDERGRLSRELHDELGALLTATKLDIARLKRTIGSLSPDVEARLAHLNQTINQGIALKREIIENLRPSSLRNLGLAAALEIQLREFTERSGILVISDLAAITASEDVQITIYRVVQESLTNIVKYASASEVRVSLRAEGARVWITVGDNGKGFDQATPRARSHGLIGMRFRVEALGGQIKVESRPGSGTRIEAWVPAMAESMAAALA
jgi:signal transduction histidine kinase